MAKRAYIFDLDNTIYPVPSIGDGLFAPLFQLIKESGKHEQDFEAIRFDTMRKPFQWVAAKFQLDETLTNNGIELLKGIEYNGEMFPFEDYATVKKIKADLFLVTTGFKKMQHSKIDRLGIRSDFKEVHVIDPETTNETKKDIFAGIVQRHGYKLEEVLVIGDDPDSEIKAAGELGIDTVLYNHDGIDVPRTSTYAISRFDELPVF